MKQWLIEPFWKTIPLLLISFSLCHTQDIYYITPTPNTPCPGEPCHTLSQYGERYFQNFNSNTTLVFLPGDHLLNYIPSQLELPLIFQVLLIPTNKTILILLSAYLEARTKLTPPPHQRSEVGLSAHGQLGSFSQAL